MLQRAKLGALSGTLIFILALSLLPAISGCAASKIREEGEAQVTTSDPAASPERILIGITDWMGYAPFVVAEEKGFFRDEGLDVKVVVFPSLSLQESTFMAGNIQFSTGFTGDYAVQAANGYPVTIIMEIDVDNSLAIIIKDKFKDLGELKGRRVACDVDTMRYLFLEKTLNRYGLTTKDVLVTDMPHEEGIVAFGIGTVDAMVITWPFESLTKILKEVSGKIAITSEDIPEVFTDCISVQNEILEDNPDMVVKVLRCYFKGLKWGEEHPDEYYEIAISHMSSVSEDLPRMMEHLIGQQSLSKEQYLLIAKEECPANPVFKPEEIKEQMEEEGSLYQHCQEVLDFCYNEGMIDSKPDPASFINNELYLEALDAYYE